MPFCRWGAIDQRQLFLRGETAGAVYDFAAGEIPKLAAKCELKGQPYLGPGAFSPDGRWIATGCWNNKGSFGSALWLWSAADGQPARKIPMGNCGPFFSGDGRWFLAAGDKAYQLFAVRGLPDGWPLVWRQPRETTSFGAGAAAFSPDGSQVAIQAD